MAKSFLKRYEQRKKIAQKKATITRELNKFIENNKQQIVTKGRADLGNVSDEKIINIFKSNFRERQDESLSIAKAKKELKNTLHTETFTGSDIIDYENVMKSLSKGDRQEFRRLRGWNEKIDLENFSRVSIPKGADNIRARYQYKTSKKDILLTLVYHEDGSYEWIIKENVPEGVI